MSRVMKFRDYQEETNKLRYFDIHNYDRVIHGWEYLMQFTGLLDSKGIEIYEGDILQHGLFKDYISEVSFKDGSFYLKSGTNACMRHFDLSNSIIIGNIHQHKHLLN